MEEVARALGAHRPAMADRVAPRAAAAELRAQRAAREDRQERPVEAVARVAAGAEAPRERAERVRTADLEPTRASMHRPRVQAIAAPACQAKSVNATPVLLGPKASAFASQGHRRAMRRARLGGRCQRRLGTQYPSTAKRIRFVMCDWREQRCAQYTTGEFRATGLAIGICFVNTELF